MYVCTINTMYNVHPHTRCTHIYVHTYIDTYIHMLSMNLQPYIMQLVCCELNESTRIQHAHHCTKVSMNFTQTDERVRVCVCVGEREQDRLCERESNEESECKVRGQSIYRRCQEAGGKYDIANGKLQHFIHMIT